MGDVSQVDSVRLMNFAERVYPVKSALAGKVTSPDGFVRLALRLPEARLQEQELGRIAANEGKELPYGGVGDELLLGLQLLRAVCPDGDLSNLTPQMKVNLEKVIQGLVHTYAIDQEVGVQINGETKITQEDRMGKGPSIVQRLRGK